MNPVVPCPSSEQLQSLASGELTDDRAAPVEAHVAGCASCKAMLVELSQRITLPTTPFGRYRVDAVLGSGGMGVVYRAWDPQLARALAIKVVRRAGNDEQLRVRLVREAQSLARLSHPHVCHVYDVGTAGDEVWVAMELIDGVTLRQWAADGRARDALIDVLLDCADGLAAAHTAGLIHRDVKPENVLVTRDGRAVVMDFGLARLDEVIDPSGSTVGISAGSPAPDPKQANLTMTGAIAGTPAYLAPEQLTGATLDARVDQFAWAAMAWELLTGLRPFPIVAHARLDAIRAGLTAPTTMAAPLAAALSRAMAAAPRDRFATMREMVEAIRDPAPTSTTGTRIPPTPLSHASPSTITARRGAGFAAVAVLALGGVSLGVWHFARAQPTDGAAAVANANANAPRDAATALAVAAPVPGAPTPMPAPLAPMPAPAPAPAAIAIDSGVAQPAIAIAAAAVTVAVDAGTPNALSAPTVHDAHVADPAALTTENLAAVAPPPTGAAGAVPPATPAQPPPAATSALPPGAQPFIHARAVGVISAFCRLPVDPAHPDKALTQPIADWGKITKRETVTADLGGRPEEMTVYEMVGHRGTYHFDGDEWSDTIGYFNAAIGDLALLCPEDTSETYTLPGAWNGPLTRTHVMLRLTAPPRIATDLASLDPLHINDGSMLSAASKGTWTLPTDRRYLIHDHVVAADPDHPDRWTLGFQHYSVDVPASTRGAKLMAAKKSVWIVLEHPTTEDVGGKPHLVFQAAAVVDDLFPH